MSKKKKILITGGRGFIACNLFEQLGNEYVLVSVGRQELDLMDADTVLSFLKEKKFDVVIHSATYDAAPKHSTKDPTKVLENNLRMFFNLVRGSKFFGKLIYFGSGAEFSRPHWQPKMKESYFCRHVPTDQYGFSKYIMTQQALLSKNIYNLRLFATFGKYEDPLVRITSSICQNAALNKPIVIDQDKKYDFLYIDDLMKIVRWFIDNKPKHQVYNVCCGQTVSFKSIAQKVLKFSGKKLEVVVKEAGLGQEYSGDNDLLLQELKGFIFTPFDKAIKDLYEWYENVKK